MERFLDTKRVWNVSMGITRRLRDADDAEARRNGDGPGPDREDRTRSVHWNGGECYDEEECKEHILQGVADDESEGEEGVKDVDLVGVDGGDVGRDEALLQDEFVVTGRRASTRGVDALVQAGRLDCQATPLAGQGGGGGAKPKRRFHHHKRAAGGCAGSDGPLKQLAATDHDFGEMGGDETSTTESETAEEDSAASLSASAPRPVASSSSSSTSTSDTSSSSSSSPGGGNVAQAAAAATGPATLVVSVVVDPVDLGSQGDDERESEGEADPPSSTSPHRHRHICHHHRPRHGAQSPYHHHRRSRRGRADGGGMCSRSTPPPCTPPPRCLTLSGRSYSASPRTATPSSSSSSSSSSSPSSASTSLWSPPSLSSRSCVGSSLDSFSASSVPSSSLLWAAAESPQTPQSCPENISDAPSGCGVGAAYADGFGRHRRGGVDAVDIEAPDLYVYCDNESGNDDDDVSGDGCDDRVAGQDRNRLILSRRRIHWAENDGINSTLRSSVRGRHYARHSPQHGHVPHFHHRPGGYERKHRHPFASSSPLSKHRDLHVRSGVQSPIPSEDVLLHRTSCQPAPALSPLAQHPLPQSVPTPRGLLSGGLSPLRLFLALALASFVLAQTYAMAVHRIGFRLVLPPSLWAPMHGDAPLPIRGFNSPLGPDGPFGPRDFRLALEEERTRIRAEIKTASKNAAAFSSPSEKHTPRKFDVLLVPRTFASEDALLLRTVEQSLRRCPSVGHVSEQEEAGAVGTMAWRAAGTAMDATTVDAAGAAAGGPPSREAPADAVLVVASDLAFTCEELDRAFSVWSRNPDRAVGFFPRRSHPSTFSSYSSYAPYAAVSDRAVFVHRSVVGSLAHRAALAEAARVDPADATFGSSGATATAKEGGEASPPVDGLVGGTRWCRELALSAAASFVSSAAPVAVAAHPLRLRDNGDGSSIGGEMSLSLAAEGGSTVESFQYGAAPCLSRIAAALGVEGGFASEERVYLGRDAVSSLSER